MSEENNNISNNSSENNEDFVPIEVVEQEDQKVTRLQKMFKDNYLDYASYVILERAVPHINDGFKPVQRRLMHAMKQLDDGRYNKVANIVGHTMQYHPHGDASIGDALVQLGQKELLIDCQGNWGNILTGDSAAAPRYIEARLTKFALEVVFNPKTTVWKSSYDGRNKEPITLPVKFPLLLAQGVEGIAVGLVSKILPHNFVELIDASIAHLENKDFELYPDFPTGGYGDFSKYNDGLRGGRARVRAKIEKIDRRTLVIREIPFGTTTGSLIDSIIAANDSKKIQIRKIEDNTAEFVEILIHLPSGVSSDKTIDALYAFTQCEMSLPTYACVIKDDAPQFIGVSEILKHSVENTRNLLQQELLIHKAELEEEWHSLSLEKWFIEKRIYKEKEYENAKSTDQAIDFIHSKAIEHKLNLIREITRDDLLQLLEIKMKRILRFNSDKAEEDLLNILEEIKKIQYNLEHLTQYTIDYYKRIKEKYGKGRERKTEMRNFDTIDTAQVAISNEKLYVNYKEGFVGYGLKKDEYVCDCSDIDDIIVVRRDGKYIISKVSEKAYFGKDILYVNVFVRNDKRTIYNVAYRDGKTSTSYIKRFAVTGVTRDREYDLTKGAEGSRILYFSANPNGEAEVVKVFLKPKPKIRKLSFEVDFKDIAIKGRTAQGNILSKHDIHKITLKEEGVSTLGGRKIWFDEEIFRLNDSERGLYLGEFEGEDKIIVFTKSGKCRLTNFDLSNHYEENILKIAKYDPDIVYTAIHYDSEQNFFYLKRFQVQEDLRDQLIISETEGSYLVALSYDEFPLVKIVFAGKHESREPEFIDAEEFIAVKGIGARGKRLTTFETSEIIFVQPLEKEKPKDEDEEENFEDDEGEFVQGEEIELEIIDTRDKDEDAVEEKPKKKEDKDKKDPPEGGVQMTLDF